VLAYTGLRWGELAALKVKRVDLTRRQLLVAESMTKINGKAVFGTPKTHQRRSVPFPRFLADPLKGQITERSRDDLVFTSPEGEVLRNNNFRRRVFDRAAKEAGLDGITPHELRHTAASLAVAEGANVKAVQRMLGHASAAMTLDVYADLFEDDLDEVADRLDQAVTGGGADYSRTDHAGPAFDAVQPNRRMQP
jgi:integrase